MQSDKGIEFFFSSAPRGPSALLSPSLFALFLIWALDSVHEGVKSLVPRPTEDGAAGRGCFEKNENSKQLERKKNWKKERASSRRPRRDLLEAVARSIAMRTDQRWSLGSATEAGRSREALEGARELAIVSSLLSSAANPSRSLPSLAPSLAEQSTLFEPPLPPNRPKPKTPTSNYGQAHRGQQRCRQQQRRRGRGRRPGRGGCHGRCSSPLAAAALSC